MRHRLNLPELLGPAFRRRRRWLLRPPRATLGTERGLLRAMNEMLAEAERMVRERVLPAAASARAELAHDAAEQVEFELERLRQELDGRLINVAIGTADRVLNVAAHRHTENWIGALRSTLGIDLSGVLRTGDLQDEFRLKARENASLIRSMGEQFHSDISGHVSRSVLRGESHDNLRKTLQGRFGVARSRAKVIARDQSQKLTSSLNQLRQDQLGVEKYQWSTSNDERVRDSHASKEGRIFRWDEPPADTGHPGEDVNCLPGSSRVILYDDVVRFYRRWYAGKLTKLITSSGEAIEATPNHPILTNTGWKPAHAVNVGDYVFQTGGGIFGALEMDVEQRQPRIGDLVDLAALVAPKEIRVGLGRDFHGDGGVDEQVEIVDAKGFLRLDGEAAIDQGIAQLVLEESLACLSGLVNDGPSGQLVDTALTSSDGFVRLGREFQALCLAQALHPKPVCLAAIAEVYARALEILGNRVPGSAEALLQRENALSGLIPSDRLVAVELYGVVGRMIDSSGAEPLSAERLAERLAVDANLSGNRVEARSGFDLEPCRVDNIVSHDFSHWVYNLETDGHWYLAQNTPVGNCRCVALAVIEPMTMPEEEEEFA